MKIAQVTATFPPYMGGTGNVCFHYSVELAKLGHEVTVYTMDNHGEAYDYPPEIRVKKLKSLFKVGNAPFLIGLAGLADCDVVHLHYPFFFGAELVYLAARLRKLKLVVTYHNDTVASGLLGLFFKVHRYTLMQLIFRGADKICVTSYDYGSQSFIRRFLSDGDRVAETPNGVDVGRFNPGVDQGGLKEKYGLADKRVVLFVGGLDRPHFFKGVEYLIQALAKIPDEKVALIIVGDGDLKERYRRVAESENVSDRVIFSGKVPDGELPRYYSAADLVVLPSFTMGEAFGIVLVEAMATGKPVIASDLPGIRTVVNEGQNGFLVSPKDVDMLAQRIRYLLENKEMSRDFGVNGRKKAEEKYAWDSIAKKIEKVYQEVCR